MKNFLSPIILLIPVFKAASVLAEGVEDISIEAITSIDPDRSLSFSLGFILILLILLTVTLALTGIVSDTGGSRKLKRAKELFLPIKIFSGFQDQIVKGATALEVPKDFLGTKMPVEALKPQIATGFSMVHLRDLSPQSATLVVGEFLKKGQRLALDLGSLPGFQKTILAMPSQDSEVPSQITVTAEVKTCRAQQGDDGTYMAGIKFVGVEPALQKDLNFYVENLCRGDEPERKHTSGTPKDRGPLASPPPTNPPMVLT